MSRFPYRQFPHRFAGSNSERQSIGDPGHCEDCVSVGHITAHPEFGCSDVGCYSSHEDREVTAGAITHLADEFGSVALPGVAQAGR